MRERGGALSFQFRKKKKEEAKISLKRNREILQTLNSTFFFFFWLRKKNSTFFGRAVKNSIQI
jgi:hypothetical protein